MKPEVLQARLLKAVDHHQSGRLADAERLYSELRRAAPHHFDVLHLAGTLALQQGRYGEAVPLLEQGRRLSPGSAVCAMRLGIAQTALGRPADGEGFIRSALAVDPKLPEAWFHLGFALWNQGRPAEAIAAYEAAIALRPDYGEAHDRLGALISDTRGAQVAEPHFRRATAHSPTLATAWCNLGIALAHRGATEEALACFDRAISLDPGLEQAQVGRGLALERAGDLFGADEAHAAALLVNPRNAAARSARLLLLQYRGGSREAIFRAHCEFGEWGCRPIVENPTPIAHPPVPPMSTRDQPWEREFARKLRVGFLSPNFYQHSVAYFLEPLLTHLDRKQFEIVLYHDAPVVDSMTERFRDLSDLWRPVAGLPLSSVEQLIRSDRMDILIDLAGHTGFNRLPLFERRPARIQATYLGYPDTSGMSAMDYRLVDAITDPEGDADRFATERLIRFAPTAWCYRPPTVERVAARKQNAPIVFGSFNNFAKISDETLSLWSRVLNHLPSSRLLLKGSGLSTPTALQNLRQRLVAARLPANRVDLLERTATVEEHLSAYRQIDIALDTYPYNGTTTTCEALWTGVPVITLSGDRHASRVGASLLTAVGHPEWIARSADDYLRIAARLAASPDLLSHDRTTLQADMLQSPLMDYAGQAARFATALHQMWESARARAAA